MRSTQVIQELAKGQQKGKEFIKWCRKENDFSDYELIDNFINANNNSHEIETFELLDTDEMWEILKRFKPKGLRRSKSTKTDTIEWQHKGKDGQLHTYTCAYNAHSIMSIFNAETRNNTVG